MGRSSFPRRPAMLLAAVVAALVPLRSSGTREAEVRPAPADPPKPARAPRGAVRAPPPDVSVAIAKADRDEVRVTLRRPGSLVALIHPAARSSAEHEATLHVQRPRGAGSESTELVWEATPMAGLATTRGLLLLRAHGADLEAELSELDAPRPAGTFDGPLHACRAHADAVRGFVVLCRLDRSARRVKPADVTGARPLELVAAERTPPRDRGPLVRLDLPLEPGEAQARAVGFVHGFSGFVLRAEASWAPGEAAPVLVVQHGARTQPVSPDLELRARAAVQRNKSAAAVSSRR
jgi:hypothetical protein